MLGSSVTTPSPSSSWTGGAGVPEPAQSSSLKEKDAPIDIETPEARVLKAQAHQKLTQEPTQGSGRKLKGGSGVEQASDRNDGEEEDHRGEAVSAAVKKQELTQEPTQGPGRRKFQGGSGVEQAKDEDRDEAVSAAVKKQEVTQEPTQESGQKLQGGSGVEQANDRNEDAEDEEDRDEAVIAAVKKFDHTGSGSEKLRPMEVMALKLDMLPNGVEPGDAELDGNEFLAFPRKRKFVTGEAPFYMQRRLTGDPLVMTRHRNNSTGRVDYRGWGVMGPNGCEDERANCTLLLWKDFKSGKMSAEDCIDIVKTRKQLLVSAVPKQFKHSNFKLTTISKGVMTLTHKLGYSPPLELWTWGYYASTLPLEKMIKSNYLKLTCYKFQPPGPEHKKPFHMVKTVMQNEGKTLGVRFWLAAEPAKNDLAFLAFLR
eukprot:g5864.t1